MALRSLSTEDIIRLTRDLLDTDGAARHALEANEITRAFVPRIRQAYDDLLIAQPAAGLDRAKLMNEQAQIDARHDDLVRGIDSRIGAQLYFETDTATLDAYSELRSILLPDGLRLINASYADEAGAAPLRAARVQKHHISLMRSIRCTADLALFDYYEELQRIAARLGELEKRRDALGEAGSVALKHIAARNQWIRVIHTLTGMLAIEGVDESTILGPIRRAEAKAESSRTAPAEQPVRPEPGPLASLGPSVALEIGAAS